MTIFSSNGSSGNTGAQTPKLRPNLLAEGFESCMVSQVETTILVTSECLTECGMLFGSRVCTAVALFKARSVKMHA